MVEVYNLLNKLEFLEEVAILEYEEWADNKEKDKENRIVKKIEKIKSNLKNDDFCKLILLSNDRLIGFISISKWLWWVHKFNTLVCNNVCKKRI